MIRAQLGIHDLQLGTALSTATASARWDTIGFDYGLLVVTVGKQLNTSATTTSTTLRLAEYDSTSSTNSTSIVADVVMTSATAARLAIYAIDTRTRKRYLHLVSTPSTTTNDTVAVHAELIRFRNEADPATSAALSASTNDTITFV